MKRFIVRAVYTARTLEFCVMARDEKHARQRARIAACTALSYAVRIAQ